MDTYADAASDDLETISGGSEGQIVVLRCTSGTRVVTVKHLTDNTVCGSDRVLNNVNDRITLEYNGSYWIMLAYADNV